MYSKKNGINIYNLGIFIVLGFIFTLCFLYKSESKNNETKALIELHKLSLKTFDDVYITEYKKNIENDLNNLYSKLDYSKLNDETYKEGLLSFWNSYKKIKPYIKWIYIAYDDNSILIDKKWQIPKEYSIKKRVWYREGIITKGIYWSEPYEDAINKKIVITVTKQIFDKTGKVKGLLAFDVDLYLLSQKISSMDINEENFIFDKNYRVLAHTNSAFLNKKLDKGNFEKNIKNNKDGYYFDRDRNAYVYIKNRFDWTIVKKLPKEKIANFNKNENNIYYVFALIVMLALIHIIYMFKSNSKILNLVEILKALQNRDDISQFVPPDMRTAELKVIEEVYTIQKLIENLEKEVLRDEETGLYSEVYLLNYGKTMVKKEQKILLLKYLNLSEIKSQYGKNVVELVLKRGAMTLNALKGSDELAFRLEKDTLAIVLNNDEINRRANYIIEEILNYKWKLHNITLSIAPSLVKFEDYKKTIENRE